MTTPIRTPKELNEANSRFWEVRRKWRADPAILETACEAWQGQQDREVPAANQFSLETALEYAGRAGLRVLKQQAVKAGTASKTDALQLLIEEIVERDSEISANQLLEALTGYQATHTVIQDIENGVISFTSNSNHLKEARISGLKDRLSRAKKKLRSR